MRIMLFMKRKKGVQFAGIGFDVSSGGGGGGGGGSSLINYSYDEQDTKMKWVDDKPIYQKTYTLTTRNGQYNYLPCDFVETLVNMWGVEVNSARSQDPIFTILSAESFVDVRLAPHSSATNIYVELHNKSNSDVTLYITIQYTKKGE